MPHVSEESPPDEYERRLAERRGRAAWWVNLWYGLTVIPYVAVPIVATYTEAAPGPTLAAGAVFVTLAAATAVVTLRSWSVLTREKRIFGLAPWAFCLLMSVPFVIAMLSR